mmetsp:Transcript_65854/g.122888  ORF Transcript_65854/g.122888 Transcript_65854/m.122888 type:complete len:602 (+) Transcript_65854:95-1900(+)
MSGTAARWSSTCLLQHADGLTEVVFSDGSAVTLHANPEKLTYFRPGGTRMCLLASCVPHADSSSQANQQDDLWAKVSTAFMLRNRYCKTACIILHLLSDGSMRQSRFARIGHVRWPTCFRSSDEAPVTEDADGCISVVSRDNEAKLVLSSHARTFTVQWWCPQHDTGSTVKVTSTAGHGDVDQDADDTDLGCRRLFANKAAAAGVLIEHAWVEQMQSVADEPHPAWACPLLMALRQKRRKCPCSSMASFLESRIDQLEALLQQQLLLGVLIAEKETGVVTAAYPVQPKVRGNVGCNDSVSPAACLGAADTSPVRVLCRPDAVTWLHEGAEITILARHEAYSWPSGIAIMTSRQCGKFWTVASCTDGVVRDEEVLCAESLPIDIGSRMTSTLICEGRKWLRHNSLCIGAKPTASIESSAPASDFVGWILVKDFTWPEVCTLSLFATTAAAVPSQPQSSDYLVRIIFDDRTRMSFLLAVPPEGWSADLGNIAMEGCFHLIDAQGHRHERSFRMPLGCEIYVELALRALRHVYAELQAAALGTTLKAIDADATRFSELLVEEELRQCEVLLALHGRDKPCKHGDWERRSRGLLPMEESATALAR